jgi:hypothetical protein
MLPRQSLPRLVPQLSRTRKGAPRQCLGKMRDHEARAHWNLNTNRQKMIMASSSSGIGPGEVIQGRPKRGGSFKNGLLHSRPLSTRAMNQNPQAFPTLLHCPDSSQHHDQGFFYAEDKSKFAKTMPNSLLSVSKFLARAVPAPCFGSAFLTTAAHHVSCLHWLPVYEQQRTCKE